MPVTEIKVGALVKIAPGMVINNFKSSTLDCTLESLIFSNGLVAK